MSPVRTTAVVACLAGILVPAAVAGAQDCGRVDNPYAGTKYDGIPLSHVRGTGVTCTRAKRVARGAHMKALGLTPPPSGVRHFSWHGWKVTGNLQGSSDRYVAKHGGKRVRWRF